MWVRDKRETKHILRPLPKGFWKATLTFGRVLGSAEAMALETGLLARLNTAYEVLDEQLKTLRAKVALKSLQF